jgi:hypothetical protein
MRSSGFENGENTMASDDPDFAVGVGHAASASSDVALRIQRQHVAAVAHDVDPVGPMLHQFNTLRHQ